MDTKYLNSLFGYLTIAAAMTACSDDNTVFNEPSQIRAYETDAQIMAQFVDLDNATGKFVINPDKKLTASDYLLNRNREELLAVSSINRDIFIREMESVNELLSSIKQAGVATAILYSTYSSDYLIKINGDNKIEISKAFTQSRSGANLVQLLFDGTQLEPRYFHAPESMTMTISANSLSKFYLYQLSFGISSESDAGTIIVTGVQSPCRASHYRVNTGDGNQTMSLKGKNLVGDGTLSVTISE